MAYSYTEKKRIRKDFSKLPHVMDVPYLVMGYAGEDTLARRLKSGALQANS